MSSATKPPPSKDHHVHNYSGDAFPLGFVVGSTHAGIKKKAGALDLGVLASTSDRPCAAAACLTRNVFKAAPVTVTAELLNASSGRARGFVVNAGCANAVTGKKGLEDAWTMSKTVSSLLPSVPKMAEQPGTLVMSTGVIGQHLPIENVTSALPTVTSHLSSSPEAWMDLAKAFMTTDTFPKLRARTFKLGDRLVRMAGIDKGAGMIAPNMGPPQPPHATLLGVIATDAAVSPAALQSALNYAVDRSFNSITVDGDMSTNDSILCLANGAAGKVEDGGRESASVMEEIEEGSEEYGVFREELREMAEELAKLVARDGEGATKFVTIQVKVGRRVTLVANSSMRRPTMWPLLSPSLLPPLRSSRRPCTAKVSRTHVVTWLTIDANWGRILCAV
jgi:glutamate N-acetyltransferase/amino-acid N-acetyltransferase